MWTNCRNTQFGMLGKWNFRYFWGRLNNGKHSTATPQHWSTLYKNTNTVSNCILELIKVCQSGVILAHEMTLSRAAVYLRCALPRLRTAMRLLVWVDDETKGAASELRTTACTLLSGRLLGRYRSLKLYVHFTRMWPFTCHMCVCLPLQTECMQCCLAKSK